MRSELRALLSELEQLSADLARDFDRAPAMFRPAMKPYMVRVASIRELARDLVQSTGGDDGSDRQGGV